MISPCADSIMRKTKKLQPLWLKLDAKSIREPGLPVAPMRGGHLKKFHFPRVALLHPHRAEVLVPRRRPLILCGRNPQDYVVGDDGALRPEGNNLHLVGHDIEPAFAELIDHFLPRVELAVVANKRKIVRESALEESSIALLRRREETLLSVHQGLLEGAGSLCWRVGLSNPAHSSSAAEQHPQSYEAVSHSPSISVRKLQEK